METHLTTTHTPPRPAAAPARRLGQASALAACKHAPGAGGVTVEPQGDDGGGSDSGGQDAGDR